jgi:hypothetical protein
MLKCSFLKRAPPFTYPAQQQNQRLIKSIKMSHRILELKAETAKQDLITLRKAAMLGNPMELFVSLR